MASTTIYQLPIETTQWAFDGSAEIKFNWDYEAGSAELFDLYSKGKIQQWNAATRLDWSQELGEDNPMGLPDEMMPISGTPQWAKMNEKERRWFRWQHQANVASQFLHGEQGALIAAAKIVSTVPDVNAKFYAATQVMDEARHVEVYKRLVHEKFKIAYPINPSVKALLQQTLADRRWDFTYLGMQVIIEGLALASFHRIRDQARNNLAAAVHAYVMQDEARHVAFGRLALRKVYPQLSEAERAEREDFAIEALYFMRDRYNPHDVWMRAGFSEAEMRRLSESGAIRALRARILVRIVPILKDIGLFGPKMQAALADMGILEHAAVDAGRVLAEDQRVADDFDRRRALEAPAAAAG